MPAITLFSSAFTDADQIAEKFASVTGYRIVDDQELFEATDKRYGIGKRELEKVVYRQPFVFNVSVRKKARAIAALKLVLSEFLIQGPCLYFGYVGHLIPKKISLRLLAVAGMESRKQHIFRNEGKPAKKALQQIRREDKRLFDWIHYLEEKGHSDVAAYDLVIPSDKQDLDTTVRQIVENLPRNSHPLDDRVKAAVGDFVLAAQVAFAVAQKGHDVSVTAADSEVTLTINKHVVMLSRLERKLKRIAAEVPGVKEVHTRVAKGYYRADICHCYNYRIPSADIRANHERKYTALYESAAQGKFRPLQCATTIQPRIQI